MAKHGLAEPVPPPPLPLEAPPAAEPPPVCEEPQLEAPPALAAYGRRFLPWMTSFCVNLALLLTLALLSVVGMLKPDPVVVLATAEWSEPVATAELQEVAVEQASSTGAATAAESFTAAAGEISLAPVTGIENENAALLTEFSADAGLATSAASESASSTRRSDAAAGLPSRDDLNTLAPISLAKGPITEKELGEVESLEAIASRVGDEIREKLLEDDLLVVWLLDASISMVDDRIALANYMDVYYDNLLAQMKATKNKHLLMNASVAFGAGARTLTEPFRIPRKATTAMRNMPLDPSGQETTCSAIAWAANAARQDWSTHRGKLMLVVLTDESGDDTLLLEETIELCRYLQASVTVIGPSAVLGTEEGFHRWVHPQLQRSFWLPVAKGPDTAVPARLRLPYWWSTELVINRQLLPPGAADLPQTAEQRNAFWAAALPAWAQGAEVNPADYFVGSFRGRELINLNSGFPPYALMRLTRETGGRYTMHDRAGDRGPFRLKKMRKYLPDYRSAGEILADITHQPPQLAITNAALITRKYAPQTPPQTYFFSSAGTDPETFRNRCRRDYFPSADDQAERTAQLLEECLALFGPHGMEEQYEMQSPRWQAWYDLNVGRLLLQSTRFAEYRAMLRLLIQPQNFPARANQITLFPVDTVRAGELSEARAREGIRLLNRCLEKNPGTPWAFLAARELAHPIALDFNWQYIPPPPPAPPGRPSPPGQPIVLPNL